MTLLNRVLETLNEELTIKAEGDYNNLSHVLSVLADNDILDDNQVEVIEGIISYQDVTNTEEQIEVIEEVYNNFNSSEEDQYIECVGFEVRVIKSDSINEIWEESLEEQIKECYDLSNVPDFVVIDWEQTVEICKIGGMSDHFSCYDGSEHDTENYFYFRTN